MRVDLRAILAKYLGMFPGERERVKPFAELLTLTNEETIFQRSTSPGHITASAFILDKTRTHMLLLHHLTLNRWLQPGGHVEAGDASLPAAAMREVVEETGLRESELTLVPAGSDVPLDIDIHPIPENKRKGEPAHFHHDFRYLFLYNGSADITIDPSESHGFQWRSLDALAEDSTFAAVVAKIRHLKIEQGRN